MNEKMAVDFVPNRSNTNKIGTWLLVIEYAFHTIRYDSHYTYIHCSLYRTRLQLLNSQILALEFIPLVFVRDTHANVVQKELPGRSTALRTSKIWTRVYNVNSVGRVMLWVFWLFCVQTKRTLSGVKVKVYDLVAFV